MVALAVKISAGFSIPVTVMCDTAHQIVLDGVQTITVSKGQDSVDFALVNSMSPGDVVVTQDYGLAAMCLARAGRVVTQNGMEIHNGNIDTLLSMRYLSKKARDAGVRTKGPSKRTPQQNKDFEQQFYKLLQEVQHGNQTGEISTF